MKQIFVFIFVEFKSKNLMKIVIKVNLNKRHKHLYSNLIAEKQIKKIFLVNINFRKPSKNILRTSLQIKLFVFEKVKKMCIQFFFRLYQI